MRTSWVCYRTPALHFLRAFMNRLYCISCPVFPAYRCESVALYRRQAENKSTVREVELANLQKELHCKETIVVCFSAIYI